MKKYLFALLLFVAVKSWSIDMLGVYPTNWWVGMKNPKVQIMLHGENIGMFTKFSITYPGVKVEKISKAESKNYVFLDLNIAATTKPGVLKLIMSGGGIGVEDVFFELKPRNKENGKTRTQGVTAKDFIYLMIAFPTVILPMILSMITGIRRVTEKISFPGMAVILKGYSTTLIILTNLA